MFAAALAVVGGFFVRSIGQLALMSIALKVLLIGVVTLILPVVLNNLIYSLMQIVLNLASSQVDGSGLTSMTLDFVGFGAFLAQSLKLPECLSVIMTGCALRFALRVTRIL